MAKYYLNDDGSITKNKKQTSKGNSYRLDDNNKPYLVNNNRNIKQINLPDTNYGAYTTKQLQDSKRKLVEEMNRYSGTTNSKGKYTLKGIFEAMSGISDKKLKKDKTYQTAQERLNELNTVLEERFNNSKEGQSIPMKIATGLEKRVVEPVNITRDEFVENPIQTIKTGAVGFGEGFRSSTNAIQGSLVDLEKALFGQNSMVTQRHELDKKLREINDPWKKTETYKKLEKGELGQGQQNVFELSANAASMLPAVATSLTLGPTAGSAVFYAQAQDNYFNEGLQRGYDERQARMYGLTMAGVETIVERLGFDEFGGLGKLAEGSIIKAALGEAGEEYVTPYLDAIVRKYGLHEDVKLKDVNDEAINGALSAMVIAATMNLAGKGFVKVDNLVNKMNNNQKVSPKDFQEAVEEVQTADPNFMNNILEEGAETLDLETINEVKQEMGIQNQTAQETSEKVEQKIKEEVKTEQPKQEQTAPNTIEQQEQNLQQSKIQEQPQIVPSTEKKKEGQLQFDLNDKMSEYDIPKENNYGKLAEASGATKEQINLQEKRQVDVLQLATDKKSAKELTVMTSPPAKVQQIASIATSDGNVNKHYNPPQHIVEKGPEAMNDFINKKVTTKDRIEVNETNRKLNQTMKKKIEQLRKKGNNDAADALQTNIDKGYYTVEHMGKNLSTEREALESRLLDNSDLETEYKHLMSDYNQLSENGKLFSIDKKTNNPENLISWLAKANALKDSTEEAINLGDTTFKGMFEDLETMIDLQLGHPAADVMAMFSVIARKNPENMSRYLRNKLVNLYKKELKYHSDDLKWIQENNPYDETNESPFRLTSEEKDILDMPTKELKEINDRRKKIKELNKAQIDLNNINEKTNKQEYVEQQNKIKELKKELGNIDEKKLETEWKMKIDEINNVANEIQLKRLNGIKKVAKFTKNAIVTLIKNHNLQSVHVGLFNISSNIVDSVVLNPLENRGFNKYQKKLSKITGIVTDRRTLAGRKQYYKGLAEGLKAVGTEFMKGVSMSDMNTKFSVSEDVDFTKIGDLNKHKLTATSKVGKIIAAPINFGTKITKTWLGFGDTPKSTAVRNRVLFEMLSEEAIRKSSETGKDSVFLTYKNEKTGNTTVYYIDKTGKLQQTSISTKDLDNFLKNKNQIVATDTMLEIAHADGEEATYSQKANNWFSQSAEKGKDFFNQLFPGWGDVMFQVYNVSSNIITEIKKHSPIAYGDLVKNTKKLKENTILIEQQIDNAQAEGKDFTKTAEYRKMYDTNYKLQHELSKSYGKIKAGTALIALGICLKAASFVTGKKSDEEEKEGEKSYRIKLGNKYIDYNFGLAGSIFKQGTILEEAFKKDNFLDSTVGIGEGYFNLITEESALNNLKQTFMSDYGNDSQKIISNYLANNISSLTTPGYVKELTLMLDDYTSRSTYSNDTWQYVINKLKGNWIFTRDELPKKFDGWGNTIKKGSNLIDSAWNTFFKNDFISTKKNDNVDYELAEMYQLTKNHNLLPLKTNGVYKNSVNSFDYKKITYTLNDKEKAQFAETYGKSAYENMKKLFNSSLYKEANNEDKAKYIEEIYENARDLAKKEFLESKGIEYYNTGQQVRITGENNRFESSPTVEAVNSNLSYISAREKIESPQVYKYATTIVKDYDIYKAAQVQSSSIEKMYSETDDRKTAYVKYVNSCSKLSKIQKAMLIKTKYSSMYKKYDEDIKKYLKSQNLSNEEYQYALKQMGLNKKKKNK